jgi:peptidoglycan/xylan/chitin deacetylase (PgdA/CDA1 family)
MTRPDRWLSLAASTLLGKRHPFVLCYHGVGSVPAGADPHGLFISRQRFGQHLDVIEQRGYRLLAVTELWRLKRDSSGAIGSGAIGSAARDVSARDVSARDAGARGVGARGVGAITFDDGLARTAREAMPMLLERGIPCTMFIATGLLGTPHPDLDGEMIMTAEEVAELAGAGVEIGAHTVDHPHLGQLPYEQILDQLRRSRAVLEDLVGRPVTAMAYPYGEVNAQALHAAEQAGYELACGCSGPGRWEAFNVPREPIHPSATAVRLKLKLAGLYGPVHTLRKI